MLKEHEGQTKVVSAKEVVDKMMRFPGTPQIQISIIATRRRVSRRHVRPTIIMKHGERLPAAHARVFCTRYAKELRWANIFRI